MPIIAKANSSGSDIFAPAPVGVHRAICCDVVDRGLVEGQFGQKHLVRLVWQLEAQTPDGKPYLIDRNFTLSLDERSALRAALESWAGKPLTLQQAAGFDLEKLIGVSCALLVVHKPSRDGSRVFANVTAVLPKQPGRTLVIRDYVRVIHRQPAPGANGPVKPHPVGPSFAPPPTGWVPPVPEPDAFESGEEPAPMTADDIPF